MEIRTERVARTARAIHNRSLATPGSQIEFITKVANACAVPERERMLGLEGEYRAAVTLAALSLAAKQPETYSDALARWRRAENKAELLRLENDALRREIESLKEDLELVLGEARKGPILIINL